MTTRSSTGGKAAPRKTPDAAPPKPGASATVDATSELPDRFRFKARGASMFVVDTETNREAGFPKASTGVVSKVLGALFADQGASAGGEGWKADLPERWSNEELGITLSKMRVAVEASHPNVILGAPKDHPEGHVIVAYGVEVDGKPMGHVLVHAEEKFVLLVDPRLQRKATQHRKFTATTLRLEVLAQGLAEANLPTKVSA